MKRRMLVGMMVCLWSLATVWADEPRVSSLTHLNVPSRQIVNISTECLSNEPGAAAEPFFYDRRRDVGAFTVPAGFSFVITDVIIDPFCFAEPNPTDRFLVVVDIGDGSRHFASGFVGAETKHYPFTGGLVVPEGTALRARNTTFSTTLVNVQLLGYVVRGPGLGVAEPFPFPKP